MCSATDFCSAYKQDGPLAVVIRRGRGGARDPLTKSTSQRPFPHLQLLPGRPSVSPQQSMQSTARYRQAELLEGGLHERGVLREDLLQVPPALHVSQNWNGKIKTLSRTAGTDGGGPAEQRPTGAYLCGTAARRSPCPQRAAGGTCRGCPGCRTPGCPRTAPRRPGTPRWCRAFCRERRG